jgi:hypothetical protein
MSNLYCFGRNEHAPFATFLLFTENVRWKCQCLFRYKAISKHRSKCNEACIYLQPRAGNQPETTRHKKGRHSILPTHHHRCFGQNIVIVQKHCIGEISVDILFYKPRDCPLPPRPPPFLPQPPPLLHCSTCCPLPVQALPAGRRVLNLPSCVVLAPWVNLLPRLRPILLQCDVSAETAAIPLPRLRLLILGRTSMVLLVSGGGR